VTNPHRGEIWLTDFGEPIGREQGLTRPAVVVSTNRLNESRAGVLIVVPCTTSKRDLPSHIELDPSTAGLPDVSSAKCEDVRAISDERLVVRIGDAPLDAMDDIGRSLRILLDL
jgi:mRNA interferase MazF